MYDAICKRPANFINQSQYSKGRKYQDSKLINNSMSEAFLNEILVLKELIFIRNAYFDISGNRAPFCSRVNINFFISLICTSDVRFSLFIALLCAK